MNNFTKWNQLYMMDGMIWKATSFQFSCVYFIPMGNVWCEVYIKKIHFIIHATGNFVNFVLQNTYMCSCHISSRLPVVKNILLVYKAQLPYIWSKCFKYKCPLFGIFVMSITEFSHVIYL